MNQEHEPIMTIKLPNGFSFDMVYVEGSEFDMGGTEFDWEKPIHPVRVSSFYLGKFQVTQALWLALEKENPADFKGENRPVENVSWNMAKDFIKKLNTQLASEGVTQSHPVGIPPLGGRGFRLPTEAEWEYAARGGRKSEGFKYAGSDHLNEVGWYGDNSYGETKAVGLKLPNELGLYDMSGNVWEWCEDDWHYGYENAPNDGSAWVGAAERGDYRVQRGGGYFSSPEYCRAAYRDYWHPVLRDNDVGFRLALSPQFSP